MQETPQASKRVSGSQKLDRRNGESPSTHDQLIQPPTGMQKTPQATKRPPAAQNPQPCKRRPKHQKSLRGPKNSIAATGNRHPLMTSSSSHPQACKRLPKQQK